MKNIRVIITCLCLLLAPVAYAQQGVAINATGAAPNPSAILDVSSTTQGVLFPQVTTAQRNAIPSPARGLWVYNLDTDCFDYFNGSVWIDCLGQVPIATQIPIVYVYTSNTTWTKPVGLKYVVVEVVGGGGNGGNGNNTNPEKGGAGGGAGGYARKLIPEITLGNNETVTVGGFGGTSSFGLFCSATGGSNGSNGNSSGAPGGIGGSGIGGNLNVEGQDGDIGNANVAGGGSGGSSVLGGGGRGGAADQAGSSGNQYGGGAGGGSGTGSGGSGASGVVIVTEYY